MFIVHAILLLVSGHHPLRYFKNGVAGAHLRFCFPQQRGFDSISHYRTGKKFGVPNTIANIAASFGSSMGQNGCAGIYPAIMVAMIAPTLGIDPLSFSFF